MILRVEKPTYDALPQQRESDQDCTLVDRAVIVASPDTGQTGRTYT